MLRELAERETISHQRIAVLMKVFRCFIFYLGYEIQFGFDFVCYLSFKGKLNALGRNKKVD